MHSSRMRTVCNSSRLPRWGVCYQEWGVPGLGGGVCSQGVPGLGSVPGEGVVGAWSEGCLLPGVAWSGGVCSRGGGDGCLVWGVSTPRGCLVWGVCSRGGGDGCLVWGVSAPRGCLVWGVCPRGGGGGCLVWGGSVPGEGVVGTWSGGVSAPGGCLLQGRCLLQGGCLLQGVCLGPVSQHAFRQTPPLNRMTDRCKKITFATSSEQISKETSTGSIQLIATHCVKVIRLCHRLRVFVVLCDVVFVETSITGPETAVFIPQTNVNQSRLLSRKTTHFHYSPETIVSSMTTNHNFFF